MCKMVNVAVHCVGHHGSIKPSDDALWGRPPLDFGQIMKGIFMAGMKDAVSLSFGPGVLRRGDSGTAIESFFLDLKRIRNFEGFPIGDDLKSTKAWLEGITWTEALSKNTREEMENLAAKCIKRNIEEVVLVACPSQIPFCYWEAFTEWSRPEFIHLRRNITLIPSDVPICERIDVKTSTTPMAGETFFTVGDPGLGDDATSFTDRDFTRIVSLPDDGKKELLADLRSFLNRCGVF
jgi:hypothetical protein